MCFAFSISLSITGAATVVNEDLLFPLFQAIRIVDDVGDLLRLRYSSLPAPNFSEKDVQLIQVRKLNLL